MSKISIKDESRSTEFGQLSETITALANNDGETAAKNLSAYITTMVKNKIQAIREDAKGRHYAEKDEEAHDDDDDEEVHVKLKTRATKKPPLKKMKKMEESFLLEFGGDSPIKLKGDDVFVEGKLVGTLENDLNDMESGITFRSTDGKLGEEFDNIKELYSFLMNNYAKDSAELE